MGGKGNLHPLLHLPEGCSIQDCHLEATGQEAQRGLQVAGVYVDHLALPS